MFTKKLKIFLYTLLIILGVYVMLTISFYNGNNDYLKLVLNKDNRQNSAIPIIKKIPDVITITNNAKSQINQILYRSDSLENQTEIRSNSPDVDNKIVNLFNKNLKEKYGYNKSSKIDKSILNSQLELTKKYLKVKKVLNGIRLGGKSIWKNF